jgi:acyl-CoA hydrolase
MSQGKPASQSRVEMTQLVLPGDANSLGTAFGGKIMQWIDLAASLSAMRHARMPCVTASIDHLSFLAPVRIGHAAILHAQVNAVFTSSLEVGVEVLTEDPMNGERRKCCDAHLTFVALGRDGRPASIPPLLAQTDEERQRERQASMRREARLALREQLRREPIVPPHPR